MNIRLITRYEGTLHKKGRKEFEGQGTVKREKNLWTRGPNDSKTLLNWDTGWNGLKS